MNGNEKQFYLGLDVSTQGAKMVVVDYASRKTILVSGVNYDRDLPEYGTENGAVRGLGAGVSESEPGMWLKAVRMLFGRLRSSGVEPAFVRAIAVSGQQHGLVTLDKEGNLTRQRSKLWNDVSTEEECREITEKCGGREAMLKEILNVQKPGYTAGKILKFKKEDPRAFERTATFFLVHNYINWFLTGGERGGVRVMEPGDTSGMALWNPGTGAWSERVCRAIDEKLISALPPVKPALEFIGNIGKELCVEFGFSADCRIGAGSGDNMHGAMGTGNVVPGLVTISLGTSGTACTLFDAPFKDPEGEIASYCDAMGRFMALLCVSNLANGYNKVLETFSLSHEEFARCVEKTPVGNRGRIIIPWFMGERTPDLPLAAPLYFGFGLTDFTPDYLCRGILEGHVLNLYEGYTRLPLKARMLYLTGGIAKSPVWRQSIADIFQTPVMPVKGEGAALGAAIHAAYTDHKAGISDVKAFVDSFVEYDSANRAEPDSRNAAAVEALRKTYLSLSKRVRSGEAGTPFEFRQNLITLTGG